jgi:hypothetical protein
MRKGKRQGRRNPVAKALRIKRARVVPSAKAYRRKPKHARKPADDEGRDAGGGKARS